MILRMNVMGVFGVARDLLVPILILFAVFAVLIAFTDLSSSVQQVFLAHNITPKGSVVYNQTTTISNTYNIFNYALPLLFVGMLTAAIVLAAQLGAAPVNYFIGGIIMMVIIMPITFILSNVMGTTFANPAWVSYANHYPLVAYIFAYLPYFIGAAGILYLMVAGMNLHGSTPGDSFRGGDVPNAQG